MSDRLDRFEKILYDGPKPVWIRYMMVLGVITLITRLVLDSRFATTSFFYCFVPFLIGIIYMFSFRSRKAGAAPNALVATCLQL